MGFRHKIFKIFYLTVFLLVVFSFSSNNSKVRAAVASCSTVINTADESYPEGLAVSTYIGNWDNNIPVRDVYHNTTNNTSEAFKMNITATNITPYTNPKGSSNGIEQVKVQKDGSWKWGQSLTTVDLNVINSNPSCVINGVNIAYNDFVMLPWQGWELWCGSAANKPVQFTVKIQGPAPLKISDPAPSGQNPGGKWYYINTPLLSVYNLQANTAAQGGSFTFNYKTNPSFINGHTNNIHAYYIEPNYDLSTITTVATSGATGSSPQTVNANVGTNVSYYLQSSFANKANIATAFHYNIQDQFELVHNGVSYYKNIGANIQTLSPDSVIGSISSGIKWQTNPPVTITIPYTFTDNNGQTITLANGDQFCMKLLTSSAADAPFPRSSNNQACANVTVPIVATSLSCSDSIQDSSNEVMSYSLANNSSSAITYGAVTGNYKVTGTVNATVLTIGAANPATINAETSGTGTITFPSKLPVGKYTINIQLNMVGGVTGSVKTSCSLYVVLKPYLKVYGGGVVTGSNFPNSDGTCSVTSGSNIATFNFVKSDGTFTGSSTDQLAMSSDFIKDFGSQNNNINGANTNIQSLTYYPNNLSFANDSGTTVNNPFGGMFDDLPCNPDYYSLFTSGDNFTNLSYRTFETTLSGFPSTNVNQNIYIYNNDLNITGNITYPTVTNVTDPSKLPYLYIIVRGGNVYINNAVTELDAFIIAEPDNSSGNPQGGNIYTCDSSMVVLGVASGDGKGTLFNNCKNPLTIKGGLIGSSIYFLRSGGDSQGSTNTATGCPTTTTEAERICYSPLYWLTNPYVITNGSSVDHMDYIQNLPPTI